MTMREWGKKLIDTRQTTTSEVDRVTM